MRMALNVAKMTGTTTFSIIQLLLMLVMVTSINACISPCFCENKDGYGLIINCRSMGLTAVPTWTVDSGIYYELTLAGSNQIATIPADAFSGINIQRLDISDNSITSIDDNAFRGIEDTLTELVLHANQMTQFPTAALSILTKLELLQIKGFNIATLPTSALVNFAELTDLSLESFQLTTINDDDFASFANKLTSLSLSDNALSSIPPSISSLTQLTSLILSHNAISSISSGTFSSNTRLEELEISNNQLQTLSQTAFSGLEASLTSLGLHGNQLSSYQLNAIASLTSLEKLNLGYNTGLNSLPNDLFANLGQLQHLNLHSTGLQALTPAMFVGLDSLQIILLAENNIASIADGTFNSLPALLELNLDTQSLAGLFSASTFSGLEDTLTSLSLKQTNFASSDWQAVNSLRSLNSLVLSKNQIDVIPGFTFQQMASLISLDLSDNQISLIIQDTMHGPENSLQTINLNDNGIASIDLCVFQQFPNLSQIMLTRNPLVCDCHLKWLREWVDANYDGLEIYAIDWMCDDNTLFREKQQEDLVCDTVVETPTCYNYTQMATTTTTTTTTTTMRTTEPASSAVLSQVLTSNITDTSTLVTWTVLSDDGVEGFLVQYRKSGSTSYIDEFQLEAEERSQLLEELEPSTSYIICVVMLVNNGFLAETTVCNSTLTMAAQGPSESQGASNAGLIAGSIIGVIALLALIVMLGFLVVRCRTAGRSFAKQDKETGPPLRTMEINSHSPTEVPQTGYNSKRFSKAPSARTQNQSNKDIEQKLDGFSPEERDKILDMLTNKGGSTLSVISTGSNMRYVPEPPRRNYPPGADAYPSTSGRQLPHPPGRPPGDDGYLAPSEDGYLPPSPTSRLDEDGYLPPSEDGQYVPPSPRLAEGYLDPVNLPSEDPDGHVYMEIPNSDAIRNKYMNVNRNNYDTIVPHPSQDHPKECYI